MHTYMLRVCIAVAVLSVTLYARLASAVAVLAGSAILFERTAEMSGSAGHDVGCTLVHTSTKLLASFGAFGMFRAAAPFKHLLGAPCCCRRRSSKLPRRDSFSSKHFSIYAQACLILSVRPRSIIGPRCSPREVQLVPSSHAHGNRHNPPPGALMHGGGVWFTMTKLGKCHTRGMHAPSAPCARALMHASAVSYG